jgi:hypothetical protein
MQNAIKNESSDHEYFTITPRLVWALSRSPYDYTLWCVIKDIAGDGGECYLSTPDLARLAMMSAGKASECRQHLLSCGLLKGEMRKDPEYPQPVWHIRIPNIWAKNTEWCEAHAKIAARLTHKQEQLGKPSQDESKEPSPGERGTTQGERGTAPDETKKNHEKIHKEEGIAPNGANAASAAAIAPAQEKPRVITEKANLNLDATPKGTILQNELTRAAAAAGRRGPRVYATIQQRDAYLAVYDHLDGDFEAMLSKALQRGMTSREKVLCFLQGCVKQKRRGRSEHAAALPEGTPVYV